MNDILISNITVTAKTGHAIVITANSGHLLEDDVSPPSITVIQTGAQVQNGGPVEGARYKIRYNVAGEYEVLRNIRYIGLASNHAGGGGGPAANPRYVFSYTG